ncbi:MAG: hypothetical protein J6386_05065 [Candidatus Synoicihabitans palmerolidicus]|nr:hypothetical protein [Candidatus Synoicihabitans palmerolidicus]
MNTTHIPPVSLSLRSVVLPVLLAANLTAQPASETQDQIESPSGSGLHTEPKFAYAFSPESDLERGSKIGDVSIDQFNLELKVGNRRFADLSVFIGLSEKYTELDISAGVPLPDHLPAVGLNFGVRRSLADWFGPEWSGTVMLQTEFSSDSSGLSDAEESFGGGVFFSYQQSPTLSWDFGVMGRSLADLPVLPLVGARWDFAPKWRASLGFPSTGVTYDYSERLKLRAGMSFDGETYHVSTERALGLGDTWLDYREIRAGVGFDYRINPHLKLILDGGVVVDREFDYFDRNYSIKGDSPGFLSVGLEARF